MPLPYRLSKHATLTLQRTPPNSTSSSSLLPANTFAKQKEELYTVRLLCQWTTTPNSLNGAQAHGAQRAGCWKSVSLGHEALPGITWYLLQCRVRPGNPGLLAPAQSSLSQGKVGAKGD
jgi:hypothetical protein